MLMKKALYVGAITIAAITTVSVIAWLIYEFDDDFDDDNSEKHFQRSVGKLVIDNDAGADDAMAIFMTLLYEKNYGGPELVALTTCNGNTNEDNVYVNNQKVLKIAGRQDIPIYRGATQSLITTINITNYFGEDGLGDTGEEYTDLVQAKEEHAANALIQLSKIYTEGLTVVSLGALTNIATVLALDPDFLSRINHLYVGAGHIHDTDLPNPEFNAEMDVEAYHILMKHATPDKVTLLPFSQAIRHLALTKEWRKEVFGAIPTEIVQQLNKFEQVSIDKEERWSMLDPAVVAAALRPDLISEYIYSVNDIHVCGEQRGINTNTIVSEEKGNTRIIYSIKTEEYKQFLLDVFSENV